MVSFVENEEEKREYLEFIQTSNGHVKQDMMKSLLNPTP
jgi:hypothetical protein